jgi:hypothetical protein
VRGEVLEGWSAFPLTPNPSSRQGRGPRTFGRHIPVSDAPSPVPEPAEPRGLPWGSIGLFGAALLAAVLFVGLTYSLTQPATPPAGETPQEKLQRVRSGDAAALSGYEPLPTRPGEPPRWKIPIKSALDRLAEEKSRPRTTAPAVTGASGRQ